MDVMGKEISCKCYTNNVRLARALDNLTVEHDCSYSCLQGTILQHSKGIKVMSDSVTVLVNICDEGGAISDTLLLTSYPQLREFNGSTVDLNSIKRDNMFLQICQLLNGKYKTSKNQFTIDFGCDGGVFEVSMDEKLDNIYGTVKSVSGSAIISGLEMISAQLETAKEIKSFSYVTKTNEFEKFVNVLRGSGEILKELARYLGNTLVLVTKDYRDNPITYYVSAINAAVVGVNSNGIGYYKRTQAAMIKLDSSKVYSVSLIAASVDDIIRKQSYKCNRKSQIEATV